MLQLLLLILLGCASNSRKTTQLTTPAKEPTVTQEPTATSEPEPTARPLDEDDVVLAALNYIGLELNKSIDNSYVHLISDLAEDSGIFIYASQEPNQTWFYEDGQLSVVEAAAVDRLEASFLFVIGYKRVAYSEFEIIVDTHYRPREVAKFEDGSSEYASGGFRELLVLKYENERWDLLNRELHSEWG